MEQGKELLEVGNGGGLESIKKGSEYCSRCFVLEKRCDEVKEWCTGLESEIEKKMSDIEELRRQIVVLPVQNDVLVSSPKTIKGSDEKDTHTTNGDGEEGEGEKCVIDLMEDLENDKVLELKSSPKTIKGSDEKDTQTTNGEEEEGEGEKCVIDLMEDLENDKVLELKSSPKTIKGSDEKDTQTTNGDEEEGEGEKCVIDLMEDLENDKVLELKSSPKTVKGSDEKDTQTTNGEEEEGEGEKCVIDLMEDLENDKVLELMIENKVLECEKKKAESDVGFWKAKCEELELRVRVLENNLSSTSGMTNVVVKPVVKTQIVEKECCDASTPLINTSKGKERLEYGANEEILHEERKKHDTRTRKQLNFGKETPDKMAPATPAVGGLPAMAGLIDISDDDDDDLGGGIASLYEKALSSGNRILKVKGESEIEDAITHCYQGKPSLLASKRKRASHIVHSDSESDTDDNVPLHRLRKRYSSVASVPSVQDDHRKKAGGIPKKYSSESKSNRGIPTTGSFTDDETDDDNESNSEGESLNGFIVSGSESDISVADKSSEGDEIANSNEKSATESEDKSEGNVDYDEIMSMIGRKKKGHLIKWEFEADMLAAFGKDPELCMKAVCALYRQQTSDEQSFKATIHQNQRGFSQCDAPRGSRLGEFLTDGDPEGGLKKSVEELVEFQPKGLDLCTTLATHYSKQLFAMYENKEDPLWPALSPDS